MKKLKWLFELQDRISGPAGRARAALSRLWGTLERGASAGLRVAGGVATAVGAIGVAATGALAGVASLTAQFGRAVLSAASFRETTLTTLELFSGSRSNALRLFGQGQRLAAATPFGVREVMGAQTQLLSQGFSEQELNPLIAFVSDLASARGDQTVMRDVINQLSQVRSLGRLQWEDLKQIAQRSGVSVSGVYDQIAQAMNLGTGAAGREAAQAAMRAHRVDANTGIRAMMDAFVQQSGGGPLGTISERQSRTLSGLFSTFQDIPETFLQSIDFENIPGINALKNAMSSIIRMMDAAGPRGQRLQRVLRTIVDSGFSRLFEGFDENAIGSVIDRIIDFLDNAAPSVETVVRGFRAFGSGMWEALAPTIQQLVNGLSSLGSDRRFIDNMRDFGTVVGTVVSAVVRLGQALAALPGFGSELGDTLYNMIHGDATAGIRTTRVENGITRVTGANTAEGFARGMNEGLPSVQSAAQRLAETADRTSRQELEVRSPSRVFERIGGYVGQGFAHGLEGASATIGAAATAMATPALSAASLGGGAAARGPVTLHIEVHGSGNANETSDLVVTKVVDFLEAMNQ